MFHRVTLIGWVGQEPQMRYTPDGTPVVNFSVATSASVSKATPGGERACPSGWKESFNGKKWELTTWWRVTCWRGLAETVNTYVEKGSQVFIEGEVTGEALDGNLNPRVWTSKDGVAKASFEVTARMVKFLGSRGESGSTAGGPPPEEYMDEESLPF